MDLRVWAKKSSEKKSVPICNLYRESGLCQKTTGPAKYLQWAAEESLIRKNHEEFTCHLPDGTRSTFLMVFSPDGTMIASTHGNHNVYITYLTSGKNVKTLSGHPRTPWCIAFHPSSNQILASGCLGGQVRVWDLHGGSEIWVVESQTVIASLAFHPTDRVLVIASYNEVHFWDWSQDKPFAKCSTSNQREKVRYVSFDKLGHRLITGIANAPRLQSQWDRVSAPQPPPQMPQSEHERRITICYRYMVEQYERLVQSYYSFSRQGTGDQRRIGNNRNIQPITMDRGTDPMEPPPVSSERCSVCRGDVSNNNNNNQTSNTNTRNDDGARASTSSSSSPTTNLIEVPGWRIHRRPQRNTVSQPRGTDERSASHSSSQFLSPQSGSTTLLDSLNNVDNGNVGRTNVSQEELTRLEAMLNVRDFNSTVRSNYLFNRLNRLRSRVESGRHMLERSRNMAASMQTMSPSSPEDLQNFEDALSSMPPPLPVLCFYPPPVPSAPSENRSDSPPPPLPSPPPPPPPLPEESPPLSPPPPPPPPSSSSSSTFLEESPSLSLPPPGRIERKINGSNNDSFSLRNDTGIAPTSHHRSVECHCPSSTTPVSNLPDVQLSNEESSTFTTPLPSLSDIPVPPSSSAQPVSFNIFNRLSSFLRGTRRTNIANRGSVATTTTSENSTDSAEGGSGATNGGNERSSTVIGDEEPQSSIPTTPLTRQNTNNAEVRIDNADNYICPTTPLMLDVSSSQRTSDNRHNTPRALRDSGSNTENYESNSSDSTSDRVLRRGAESSSAIARLRAQFRRLQSAYNNRDRELMLLREAEENAERRLITRLRALLERSPWISTLDNNSTLDENTLNPSTSVTPSIFPSHPGPSSSPTLPTAGPSTSFASNSSSPPLPPSDMASVRYGLLLLSRHIDNLSSQFRMDLEMGQANHIRRLWRDLRNQICALSLTLARRTANTTTDGNSQENTSSNIRPTSSANEPFSVGVPSSSSSVGSTINRPRPEASTSEASTSGTSSVTEEDDDESDVSARSWFWLRRQSRRSRQQMRLTAASHKRARIDFRLRDGVRLIRGGANRVETFPRVRLYEALWGPSDGSNDDDDEDDDGDEDEEVIETTAGLPNLSRPFHSNSTNEGLPNRGIKRKSNRIPYRPRDPLGTNSLLGITPLPSTSTGHDTTPRTVRPHLRFRPVSLSSQRSHRTAQRSWHHSGYRSQWSRDSHAGPSDQHGEGPSTSRQSNRDDTSHREAIRRRARHVLLLMVDSITQFFENDTFTTSGSNENLNERTTSLINLLELALELTDLLLSQLDLTRRRRQVMWQSRAEQDLRPRSEEDRRMRGGVNPRRHLSPIMHVKERWDRWMASYTRMLQNGSQNRDVQNVRPASQPATSGNSTPSYENNRVPVNNSRVPLSSSSWSLYDSPTTPSSNNNTTTSNSSSNTRAEIRLPILRVNDGPVPEEGSGTTPYNRLGGSASLPRRSSSSVFYPPLFRPRLLHPRYFAPYYVDDNSTASEDSSQQDNRGGGSSSQGDRSFIENYNRYDREFFIMRGAYLMGDSAMAPHHRIQAWDFTKFTLPEISNAAKNIVVEECKIHNDASVDMSYDGKILVTLLPSGRLSITTMLGVFSLEWETLGQVLYTTSFDQNAVSVSLSPTTRHLIVGLASRRIHIFHTDRHTIAQIFRLEGGRPGFDSESPTKGKLVLVRDLEMSRVSTDFTSLNCIRWAPTPGEGFVYGTNSGKLKVLR